MKFPEPTFHILPESVRLEQSEDRRDSSACDQAAQHPAGNRHLTAGGWRGAVLFIVRVKFNLQTHLN